MPYMSDAIPEIVLDTVPSYTIPVSRKSFRVSVIRFSNSWWRETPFITKVKNRFRKQPMIAHMKNCKCLTYFIVEKDFPCRSLTGVLQNLALKIGF